MDNSDQFADILAQIATEEAALSELCNMQETLQNEAVAKQAELERVQGVKRKQQEKHTQPKKKQKTGQNTKTHCVGMSSKIYHGTNMASTSISTGDNVCVDETSVNGEKEHLAMAKSDPLTAVRNLMGEFDGVKITKNKHRKRTMQNEEEQQQEERE